ncbi:DUF2777 family protein [Bacillus coahuilensis]|uniref:DUF2777 family protein n=1 Tax=Bacillus coahuilensis TaxID=408580 RepID=UPI0002E41C98|nr:DUF2777 family protein [Bacillus coahuilensis]
MNSPERFALLNRQDRAFITGTVEKLNDQWVFFDDENDEATMLEFFDDYQLEVMNHNKWRVAEILSDHELAVEGVALPLLDGMELRLQKKANTFFWNFVRRY